MELRPYQQKLVNDIRNSICSGNHSVCAVLGCGGGKSCIEGMIAQAATAKQNQVLFLVHRKELCDQIRETFTACGVDFKYCDIYMVQTACRRIPKLKEPKLIITDECFAAGTRIDGIPIEKIKKGDSIYCFGEDGEIHRSSVVNIMKKIAPAELVNINGTICTKNHPFFTPNGWCKAENLKKGDFIYEICMPDLRSGNENQICKNVHKLLSTKNDKEEQGNCFAKNERPQSHGEKINSRQNGCDTQKDRSQTKNSWRKWNRINKTSSDVKQRSRLGYGSCSQNKNSDAQRISSLLQNRCGKSKENDWNRSRRTESLLIAQPSKGQKENCFLRKIRVENITVYKQTDNDEFKRVCQDGYVYNLEVEKYHTYFANGYAVHNCHHSLAQSYRSIYGAFPDASMVGFTATPARMNEGGLGSVFDDLIESVSIEWLIENHYLAPYKYFGVTLADTSKLHTKNGDFDKEEVAELMDKSAIFGGTVENWRKQAEGKQTIVYCANIKTSIATADEFKRAGVLACHLDGTTPKKVREDAVEDFRQGEIKVLCNVDLFGEGFDVPDCECVVLLRPTKSLTLHIQQSMRPMRYKDGKTAIILDHVGNFTRHGLPDDKREWSLAAKKKKKKNDVTVKQCPKCYMVMKSGLTQCPFCGFEFPISEERERERVEGIMLTEISRKPYSDYKKCKSWEDLDMFRKAKKYKIGWSIHKAFELHIQIPQRYRWTAYKMGLV